MSEADLTSQYLPDLKKGLSEIVGTDLAESLVNAALAGGELNLDMQLAINDGLEEMSEEQRSEVLGLLKNLRRDLKAAREG